MQADVVFDVGDMQFSAYTQTAKDKFEADFDWIITGDGLTELVE